MQFAQERANEVVVSILDIGVPFLHGCKRPTAASRRYTSRVAPYNGRAWRQARSKAILAQRPEKVKLGVGRAYRAKTRLIGIVFAQ